MHIKPHSITALAAVIFTLLLASCGSENDRSAAQADGPPRIVATTGMLGDAVANLVGSQAQVETLMGPGVDPHLYKATHGDLERLESADIIVYNGLHLEGKMVEVLERLAKEKPVIAMAEMLRTRTLISADNFESAYDPHIWFDVSLWTRAIKHLRDTLSGFDFLDSDSLMNNTRTYVGKLEALDKEVKETLAPIPLESRVLITAHDAFGYFGQAYDFEVRGLQGLSTLSEFGLRDRVDLVDMIVRRNIKAIFVETSVSRQAIDAVIESSRERGHELMVGGRLFSDAMGEPGTEEGTYIGMIRANVRTIAAGLQ